MPNTNKILAIDPGTRHMGLAFLGRGKLHYYGVKNIKNRSASETLKEGRKLISRLIREMKPTLLAVEKTFFGTSPNAALLNLVSDEIRTVAKRLRVPVVGYAPTTVKKFITGFGHATKKEVAKAIVIWHPELRVYLTQDRAWKERYHQNMFDAVALAMMTYLRNVPPEERGRLRRPGRRAE